VTVHQGEESCVVVSSPKVDKFVKQNVLETGVWLLDQFEVEPDPPSLRLWECI
jgi:hypothetical protein